MEGQDVLVLEDNFELAGTGNGEVAVEVVAGVAPVGHSADGRGGGPNLGCTQ